MTLLCSCPVNAPLQWKHMLALPVADPGPVTCAVIRMRQGCKDSRSQEGRQSLDHLGCRAGVCGDVEHKTASQQADSRHQMKGKAPPIHSKWCQGADVGCKETSYHAS